MSQKHWQPATVHDVRYAGHQRMHRRNLTAPAHAREPSLWRQQRTRDGTTKFKEISDHVWFGLCSTLTEALPTTTGQGRGSGRRSDLIPILLEPWNPGKQEHLLSPKHRTRSKHEHKHDQP
jgi:hypothetical protein